MARRRFDPSRIVPPARGEPAAPPGGRREQARFGSIDQAKQLTVSQLSELIKQTLEQRISSPLRVVGQVSNLSVRNHWYFSLKDEQAVVSCAAWASSARKFGFTPNDGDEVVVSGHVSHYSPQGRTQLYVSSMQPVGAGALELRFRQMCQELRLLGYFDAELKRAMPPLPSRIAVITSAGSAAMQDVIATAGQRNPAVVLLIVDVRVQGETAAAEIARAIRWVDANHGELDVDAILVTRGGGSIEDLWAFNERAVADATYQCRLPLVAAIGHESDTTVIELVADLRAATPTQAVMHLVPAREELTRQLDHMDDRLRLVVRRLIEAARQRLELLGRHHLLTHPARVIDRAREKLSAVERELQHTARHQLAQARGRLDRVAQRIARLHPATLMSSQRQELAVLEDRLLRAARHRIDQRDRLAARRDRLESAVVRRIAAARAQISAMARELVAIDPRLVLTRGYSYTTTRRGTLVRSTADARSGQVLLTHLADGLIESTVAGKRPRRRTARTGDSDDQMDLFASAQ